MHDDCSSDDSAAIIREYSYRFPDIIKPILEDENQYGKGGGALETIVFNAVRKTDAKYVAFCEGDDCWVDPQKLQRYVEFLEENESFSMCYSAFDVIDENGIVYCSPQYENYIRESFTGNVLPRLFIHNFILTNTVCIRMNAYDLFAQSGSLLDYSIFFAAAFLGKAKFFKERMSRYRIHRGGMTSSNWAKVNFLCEQTFLYWANRYFEIKPRYGLPGYLLSVKRIITHDYSIPGVGDICFPRIIKMLNKLYCTFFVHRKV